MGNRKRKPKKDRADEAAETGQLKKEGVEEEKTKGGDPT
jgi:hypothetical protein